MEKKKIVVVGNCQARPLAMAFERLSEEVEVTAVAIVHLLKTEQFEDYRQCFEEADIIVAQLVADNYACEFVRTGFLKDKYGDKVVSVVNLYFTGYNPDWCYIRVPGKGPLRGPMGDYHNKTIVDSWKKGLLVENTAALLLDKGHNSHYEKEKDASLDVLRSREERADVSISDFIEGEMRKERLFFTFNHPASRLIVEYGKRVLFRLGVEFDFDVEDLGGREPLSQFLPLVNPSAGLPGGGIQNPSGMAYEIQYGKVILKQKKDYSLEGLVKSFYEIYHYFRQDESFAKAIDRL